MGWAGKAKSACSEPSRDASTYRDVQENSRARKRERERKRRRGERGWDVSSHTPLQRMPYGAHLPCTALRCAALPPLTHPALCPHTGANHVAPQRCRRLSLSTRVARAREGGLIRRPPARPPATVWSGLPPGSTDSAAPGAPPLAARPGSIGWMLCSPPTATSSQLRSAAAAAPATPPPPPPTAIEAPVQLLPSRRPPGTNQQHARPQPPRFHLAQCCATVLHGTPYWHGMK